MEELKAQVADEKKQRQVVAQCLTENRREAERLAQQKQEHWNFKFKELQREKHMLSMRLQVFSLYLLRFTFSFSNTSWCFPTTSNSMPDSVITRRDSSHEKASPEGSKEWRMHSQN